MKIALDVMGGDNAPTSNILGVKRFLNNNPSLDINIIEVVTDTHNAPITGATLFHMVSKVYLKENKKEQLQDKLSKVEADFGLVTKLERI